MKNMFESKKFSLILGGLILLFLGISGFILLGDTSNSVEKISQVTDDLEEDIKESPTFKEEEPELDPNYEEEISKQYEEYQKLQEEKKKDSPKKPTSPTSNGKTPNKGNVGGTIGGGSGGSNGGNGGKDNGGGKDDNSGVINLPPINIGNPNPTVPKLPNEPKPPVTPPVTPPDDGNNPPDDGNNPPDDGNNPPDDGNNPPDDGNNPPDDGNNPPDDGNNPPDDGNNPPPIVGDGDFGSIIPAERPAPIDTAPHNPPTEKQTGGKTGLSMISTNYANGFAIVPIKYETNTIGASAEFEFYNATDTPMTLQNSNIGFIYDKGYGDFADSNLGGSPLVIQPKQTVKLYVSSSSPEAKSMFFKFNGVDSYFSFGGSTPVIQDVKPLSSSDIDIKEDSYVESISVGHVSGNTNLKVEPLGIVLASNNQIGVLNKAPTGALGLVKVRLANTSNKEITIQELIAGSWDFEADNPNAVTFPLKDLSLLGGNALPTKIPAKTIVEGYLPFYLKDSNHVSMIYVKTSDIDFQIKSIESFGLLFE